MDAMPPLIEAEAPGTWQELETTVAQILRECGYDVEVQKNVQLARGDVNLDVWADDHSSPPAYSSPPAGSKPEPSRPPPTRTFG